LRLPFLVGLAIMGLAYLGMAAARNIWHLYLASFVIGFMFGGVSMIPVSIIITRHFTKNTGTALSIAMAGSGLGGMVLNPIFNHTITSLSWQIGYLIVAGVILLVALPCAALVTYLVRDELEPAPAAQTRLAAGSGGAYWRAPWYWALLIASLLAGLIGTGIISNLPSYTRDLNFSIGRISFVTSAYAASMLVGKFLVGIANDKFGAVKGTIFAGSMVILTALSLHLIENPVFLAVMLLSIGVGVSMGTVSTTWLTNRFFSKADFSSYFGGVQFFNSLGIAIGLPFLALVREKFGSYTAAWWLVFALSLVMLALFLLSIHGNRRARAAEIAQNLTLKEQSDDQES
jgi:MFS family permease